jgi:flagellar basal body-associated protein FliL
MAIDRWIGWGTSSRWVMLARVEVAMLLALVVVLWFFLRASNTPSSNPQSDGSSGFRLKPVLQTADPPWDQNAGVLTTGMV